MPAAVRYLLGEFTNGEPPREFPVHQEKIKYNIMVFFMIMELIQMLHDKGAPPSQEVEKAERPLTGPEKLRRGHCFPFVECLMSDIAVVSCCSCNSSIDRELALALIKSGPGKCPYCKKEGAKPGGAKPGGKS
jgi:hypothetical protein